MAPRRLKQAIRPENSRIAKRIGFSIDGGLNKKTVFLIWAAAGLCVVSLISNVRSVNRARSLGYHHPEAEPPAKDAAEWLERFKSDKRFRHAFSELPPQSDWEPVISRLRQPGENRRACQERIFGEVLAGDRKAAEQSIRDLLLTDTTRTHSDSLKYLYAFSEDPAATRQWVDQSLPKAEPDDGGSYSGDEFATLLAENRVDEAIKGIREKADSQSDLDDKLEHLGRIAKIARLTNRQPLHGQVVEEMKTLALGMPASSVHNYYVFTPLIEELVLLEDWSTVGKIGTRFRKNGGDSGFLSISLAAAYRLEGPAAFLREMKACPQMGIIAPRNYAELLTDPPLGRGMGTGEMTVRAFMAAGEKDKARTTLEYLLALDMGNDTFYRLAIEFFPDRAGAMFESLRPYNPYQERPLIWLGEIALGKNDLARAQEFVDQAIALDPSDGEQGKFTRMQVYDVLSRILRAEGDAGRADFFNGVMKAIRRGEEADDYLNAGLTQEAIRRYEEALGHFGDAYCLQSRLAKTLMKAGKEEEAIEHFEKAFELMPVSFGPVESHCFGCEGIFEGDRVKEIAVNTFNRIIESTPDNPRTFYLLGLVLEEMNKPEEAAKAMRKALELDPKYYNCARHLVDLARQNPESAMEAESLQNCLAGMAPYQDLQRVYQARTDLRQLWQDAQTPPPCPIKLAPLPLPFDPTEAVKDVPRSWTYYYELKMDALDGWSTEELLKNNTFLQWFDHF